MEEMTKHTTAGLSLFTVCPIRIGNLLWACRWGLTEQRNITEPVSETIFSPETHRPGAHTRTPDVPPPRLQQLAAKPVLYCCAWFRVFNSLARPTLFRFVSFRSVPFRSVSFRWSVPICSAILRFFSFCFDSIRFVSFRWPVPISSGKFRFFVSFRRVATRHSQRSR